MYLRHYAPWQRSLIGGVGLFLFGLLTLAVLTFVITIGPPVPTSGYAGPVTVDGADDGADWLLLAVNYDEQVLADFAPGPIAAVSDLFSNDVLLDARDSVAVTTDVETSRSADIAWLAASVAAGSPRDAALVRTVLSSDVDGVVAGDRYVRLSRPNAGDVDVVLERDGETFSVRMTVDEARRVVVAAERFELGGSTRPEVLIPEGVGGSSAGLLFALAFYEFLEPGFAGDKTVAATGVVNGVGDVAAINGVEQKVQAAEAAGADVIFVPSKNTFEARRVASSIRVVGVNSLGDAISVLERLS